MKRFGFVMGLALAMLTAIQTTAGAQNVRQGRKYVRHGNRQFRADKLEDANVEYRRALDADSTNTVARYNLSRAMFPLEWLGVKDLQKEVRDTMRNGFLRAAEEEQDPVRRSMSYYNAGVLFQRSGELKLAIDAYKEALRQNPHDDEARYNLAICKHLMKDQPQDNQQQNNDQNDQNDQQQQQKDEQKQDQQKPQGQKKDDGQNQQEQQKQQQKQQPPMSQENAEQLLQNVKREEDKTQRRMQQQEQRQSNRKEKNW